MYDKRVDFNFEIVKWRFFSLPFLRCICSNVSNFNKRTQFLTATLLKQGYRYHEIRKAFSYYHGHPVLIVKYTINLYHMRSIMGVILHYAIKSIDHHRFTDIVMLRNDVQYNVA